MATLTLILTFICTSIAFGAASCPQLIENQMTAEDINTVVNKHNQLRALVAAGKVPDQPRGVNIGNLKWDPTLANEAQKIANTCIFAHVSVNDPRWYVGQNLYKFSSTAKGGKPDWNGAVQSWFNEHKNFKYPNTSNGVTGHYTQVVWADTMYIGCGYTYNFDSGSGWYEQFYVCNYGPGGNYKGEAPYRT